MRWHELSEAVNDNFLYHGTDARSAARILEDNAMRGMTQHRTERLGYPTKYWDDGRPRIQYINGISLSRSLKVATGFGSLGVVFVLDATKIRFNYKVKPVDYFGEKRREWHKDEMEEFIITQTGLAPIERYLVQIIIGDESYRECVADDQKSPDDPEFKKLLSHPKLKIIEMKKPLGAAGLAGAW